MRFNQYTSMMTSQSLLMFINVQVVAISSMCANNNFPCDTTKENCCGCPSKFNDPFDNQVKFPYSVVAYGGECDDDCIQNLPAFSSCAIAQEEAMGRQERGTFSYGHDIVFDINISKSTGKNGKIKYGEIANGTATDFMVKLARELRINTEPKGTIIGALCFFGNLTMHFGLNNFTNVDDLVNGLFNMDLTPKDNAKPHKSFDFIRENYFQDSIYGGRRDNRNIVIVFDDGIYSRQGHTQMDRKFRTSIENLHMVSEVFIVGVRNGFSVTQAEAIRNWNMIASDPDGAHIITMSLEEYNDGRIDDVVHRTLELLPKSKQT
ncbi:unnamed protein product [Owenia fusiformis]|uniref:Uncharacterized protein n=1 Tax=Owenia fusiformis TaxID=6347 RepID=A0A8J1Y8Q0_OWEFU|nr:unnamed protein product [Owenia fusiformis]